MNFKNLLNLRISILCNTNLSYFYKILNKEKKIENYIFSSVLFTSILLKSNGEKRIDNFLDSVFLAL